MNAKKTILFCAGLALLAAGASAGVQEDFSAANRLYEEGKFAAALPLYLDVSKRVTDWKVLYDIGNCHYKLEQFLAAKIYYLKARKLRPLDDSLARNIAMTNRHFRDLVSLPEPDFVSRSIQVLESNLSLDSVSVLLLAAVLLLNACLFLLQTRGKNKKVLYATALFIFLTLAFGAYHASRVSALGRSDTAVIRQADSLLRSGPGEDNTVLFKVNPGLEVKIIDRFHDWVQVTASAQIAGWIEKNRLALI
jgi:tetratricopeptide (TPR) repeat protein